MENDSIKKLCSDLIRSETEEEVIQLLTKAGYWDDSKCWRYYGDTENNYSSAGNQADEAESALIEKITNSRDAILMNECLLREIDPESQDAPKNVRDAVAIFFDEEATTETAGQIREWDEKKRREIARNISVYITGNKPGRGFPCINIADKGEGQSPTQIPKTILSLGKSIKLRVPFAHGKFNMGGTAALVYCGRNNLQLVISKRNPKLLNDQSEEEKKWGFTIVRREDPKDNLSSSIYKYLAPINASEDPTKGEILSFESEEFPIFAKYNEPYSVNSKWGTFIKLYEYETRFKQNVQGAGGLLRPLDLLAPDLGLPFRLHECRYEGTPGSFEHQVNGLRVRLFDDKGKVLEEGYPTTDHPTIEGEEFTISVYAFKEDKAKSYRESDKGVIFTLNGQSQGWLDDRIFNRKSVRLGFLRKSLLIMVDCSKLNYRAQERLFVNDRVHLRKTSFRDKIVAAIEDYLGNHQGLEDLQEERKRKLKSERIDDSRPLEAVLSNVFKHSASLSKIFLKGQRLSNAFKTVNVGEENKPFKGEEYPTTFKFQKIEYGKTLNRTAHIDSKCRITFVTDAENIYFIRKKNPGTYKLFVKTREELIEAKKLLIDYSIRLYNGIATLSINIDDKYEIGDKLYFQLQVTDPMRIIDPPFTNDFILDLIEPVEKKQGKPYPRRKSPSDDPDLNREIASGIQFPEIIPIYEENFAEHGLNKYSAIKAISSKGEDGIKSYTFLVNRDNIYLQNEIKQDINNKDDMNAYFDYGMALIGISLIYDNDQNNISSENEEDGTPIEDKIEEFSRAVSPILIPMIKEFGEMDLKSDLLRDMSD